MPTAIPGETDHDVLMLKMQGAQAILVSLKAFLKMHKKELHHEGAQTTAEHRQLTMLIEILHHFIKALETPYPPNSVSAGMNYFWNPKKYTKEGAAVIHHTTNNIIPSAITAIMMLAPTETTQQMLCIVLKHLIALKLGEDAKQDAINRGDASMADRMAHDVLQKQEPKMNFTRVANLLVQPLIETLRERLCELQQANGMAAAPSVAPR